MNQSVLTLPNLGADLSYQNSGYYVCTATNGIPNRSEAVKISKEVYFDLSGISVLCTLNEFP